MNRRHHIDRPAAPPARGEDPARPACEGNWEPFDVLMEKKCGPEYEYALKTAQGMCATCPLFDSCVIPAAERGEQWAQAILGQPVKLAPPDTPRSRASRKNAEGRWAQFNAARADDLRVLINAGAEMPEVLASLKMTRAALWKWCDNHGHKDLWRALSPGQPECVATLRTRGKKKREAA